MEQEAQREVVSAQELMVSPARRLDQTCAHPVLVEADAMLDGCTQSSSPLHAMYAKGKSLLPWRSGLFQHQDVNNTVLTRFLIGRKNVRVGFAIQNVTLRLYTALVQCGSEIAGTTIDPLWLTQDGRQII
jgi:hypothetical protein